ncbi:unnamed protein product [Protopolystoma xenopodis]|uniref:Uncharacterized protein n=1 Tax=Protopolystoma xenopodis TaxID=117903 RepID=A0A448WRA3_9PLAT|nr:unnamed protein product [Protopolystoma xenopodis]
MAPSIVDEYQIHEPINKQQPPHADWLSLRALPLFETRFFSILPLSCLLEVQATIMWFLVCMLNFVLAGKGLEIPGTLYFSPPDAHVEMDTVPMTCSRLQSTPQQTGFRIVFSVFVETDEAVVMAGVSGYSAEQTATGGHIDSSLLSTRTLGLLVYLQRPYVRLNISRLSDGVVRLLLQHTIGFFEASWEGWHDVEVGVRPLRLGKLNGLSRSDDSGQVVFRYDNLLSRGHLPLGDVLWPRPEVTRLMQQTVRPDRLWLGDELFFGLPPTGSLSRQAAETLYKSKDTESTATSLDRPSDTHSAHDNQVGLSTVSGLPGLLGRLSNVMLEADCTCDGKPFGPRFLTSGGGISWLQICDTASFPGHRLWQGARTKVAPAICGTNETVARRIQATGQPCVCNSHWHRGTPSSNQPTQCFCPKACRAETSKAGCRKKTSNKLHKSNLYLSYL